MEDADLRALSQQLLAKSFPRVLLLLLLLLALAGLGVFLSSVAMLHAGLASMPARSFIAERCTALCVLVAGAGLALELASPGDHSLRAVIRARDAGP